MDIVGKVAVVTGGASGIGRGMARALARGGADVVVADVEIERAEAVAEELRRGGVRSVGVGCDVSERASIEALADRAWAELGHVDILCNNAGVGVFGPIVEHAAPDVSWIFAVNFFAIYHGCGVFVPRMRQQGRGGHILNTGSEHSLGIPFPGMGIYTASKHAVLGFSDVLRQELAPDGIGVSILCPGVVNTAIWNAGRNRPARFGGRQDAPDHFAAVLATGMDPDEVGRLAVDGIRRGDFYILSHPEIRPMVEARYQELLAAFDAAAQRGR